MQDTSVPPCMSLVLLSSYPSAEAQRESVLVSPCVGSLRGTVWGFRNFFHQLHPLWFLEPEVVWTYLPDTGTVSWGTWCGAGTPCSQDIPPEFLSTHLGE